MNQAPIWHRAPFLRLIIPLVAGISMGEYLVPGILHEPSGTLILLITCLLFTTSLSLQFSFIPLRYRPAPLSGILLNTLLFFSGTLLYHHQKISNNSRWFGHHLKNSVAIAVSADGLPSPGKKSLRYILSIHAVIDKKAVPQSATGKITIYLPQANPEKLQPGSFYLLPTSKIKTITASGNPGSFDYARFQQNRNIYHQAYLSKEDVIFLKNPVGFSLSRFLAAGQSSALKAMRQTVPEPARALAMALLIGYRNEVDKDLLQAYTNTGVVHVIAVSGMHLGLIFLLLQQILVFPEGRFPFTKWIKAAIILLITWWFSGIAGASPSIIRAAFMFSMILFARLLRKPMDSFQSLSLGAFSLLCYNPFWLWDAGFQLSFAALLSIVIYQGPISSWLEPSNKIAGATWQLLAVTLAAQILTMPISIGQFHQAPAYFLFANLLAVPLSSIALITAIIQWVCSFSQLPVTLPGKLTGLLIDWMNAFILRIDSLPGAVIDQLQWSSTQTWLAYGIITSITLWLLKKNRPPLLLGLILLLLFGAERLADHATKSRQHLLAVYHLPGKSAVEIIRGNTSLQMLTAFSVPQHPVLQAAKRHYRVKVIQYSTTNFLQAGRFRIALPQNQHQAEQMLRAEPTHLILSRQVKSIRSMAGQIQSNCLVIIDGSVFETRAKQWEEELQAAGIRCHNTWTAGAFLVGLKSGSPREYDPKFQPIP